MPAMSEFRSRWLQTQPETLNDRTAKSPGSRPACEHPLHLPESRAIRRCIRCQSEAEFVDTLARIKMHHERTRRAVAARVKELRAG